MAVFRPKFKVLTIKPHKIGPTIVANLPTVNINHKIHQMFFWTQSCHEYSVNRKYSTNVEATNNSSYIN